MNINPIVIKELEDLLDALEVSATRPESKYGETWIIKDGEEVLVRAGSGMFGLDFTTEDGEVSHVEFETPATLGEFKFWDAVNDQIQNQLRDSSDQALIDVLSSVDGSWKLFEPEGLSPDIVLYQHDSNPELVLAFQRVSFGGVAPVLSFNQGQKPITLTSVGFSDPNVMGVIESIHQNKDALMEAGLELQYVINDEGSLEVRDVLSQKVATVENIDAMFGIQVQLEGSDDVLVFQSDDDANLMLLKQSLESQFGTPINSIELMDKDHETMTVKVSVFGAEITVVQSRTVSTWTLKVSQVSKTPVDEIGDNVASNDTEESNDAGDDAEEASDASHESSVACK